MVSVTPASDRTVTETPSAPPLATMPSGPAAPLATMGSGSTAADPSEEQLCVICLSARREAGYLVSECFFVSPYSRDLQFAFIMRACYTVALYHAYALGCAPGVLTRALACNLQSLCLL